MNTVLNIKALKLPIKANPLLAVSTHVPKADANHPDELAAIEAIHIRADTITPVLKDILDFRPTDHWGINE